jgi:hypothetical protein
LPGFEWSLLPDLTSIGPETAPRKIASNRPNGCPMSEVFPQEGALEDPIFAGLVESAPGAGNPHDERRHLERSIRAARYRRR